MKTGLIAVVCVALGFVAGVFAGPSIRGEGGKSGPAAAPVVVAKSAESVDELFCGEAKDGELVKIEDYGEFRLNPKQKELVEKNKIALQYRESHDKEIAREHPWVLTDVYSVGIDYRKMLAALLESRKKAAANK